MKTSTIAVVLFSVGTSFCAPIVWAENFEVSGFAEFENAWNLARDGDVIRLLAGVTISSGWSPTSKAVVIDGGSEMIRWDKAGGECTFLAKATLSNVTIHAMPSTIAVQDGWMLGSNVVFSNNNETVLTVADGARASIAEGTKFDYSNSSGGGAAIRVGNGSSVTVGAGSSFKQGIAIEGWGGAIHLEDNDEAMAPGSYNLIIESREGVAETTFSENQDADGANDIYFGSNTSALVHTEGNSKVRFESAISSADETSLLEKTGAGTLLVYDASYFYGNTIVKEGTLELKTSQDNACALGESPANGATVAVQKGATLKANDNVFVNVDVNLEEGGTYAVAGTSMLAEGAAVTAEGSATIRLEEGAELVALDKRNTLNVQAKEGMDIVLKDASLSGGKVVGNAVAEGASFVSNAALTVGSGQLTLSDITLTETTVNAAAGKSIELSNVVLTVGSTGISGGGNVVLMRDVSLIVETADIFTMNGTSGSSSTVVMDTVVIAPTTETPVFDMTISALLALKEAGVNTFSIALFNDVTVQKDMQIQLGENISWVMSQGLKLDSTDALLLAAGSPQSVSLCFTDLQNVKKVPEPATTTLSLLALASLMVRRRR